MPEEIKHYKAPIAVIPKRAILHGELHVLERRLRRCKKQESVEECNRGIADVKRRLAELERETTGDTLR